MHKTAPRGGWQQRLIDGVESQLLVPCYPAPILYTALPIPVDPAGQQFSVLETFVRYWSIA